MKKRSKKKRFVDIRQMDKSKEYEVFCPYCGAKARLVKARDIYGAKAVEPEEWMYACRNFKNGCDAYVTTHHGTTIPKGSLANSELRNKRIKVHQKIDQVVRTKAGLGKSMVYDLLCDHFSLPLHQFHVGSSDLYYCTEAIRFLDEIITNQKFTA